MTLRVVVRSEGDGSSQVAKKLPDRRERLKLVELGDRRGFTLHGCVVTALERVDRPLERGDDGSLPTTVHDGPDRPEEAHDPTES